MPPAPFMPAATAFGWASGSFHGEQDKSWKFPAAFRATVREDQVAESRVWADIESMRQSARQHSS